MEGWMDGMEWMEWMEWKRQKNFGNDDVFHWIAVIGYFDYSKHRGICGNPNIDDD